MPKSDRHPSTTDTTENVDFIELNKTLAQSQTPKRHSPTFVDKETGDRFPINGSGLTKVFLYKDDFGETPEYIKRRQLEKQRTERLYQKHMEEIQHQQQLPKLTPEEREVC